MTIYNTLLAKGTKTPAEKLQVMSVLNVMAFIPSIEQNSQRSGKSRSSEEERFRENLAKLLSSQGVEAVKVYEDVGLLLTSRFHFIDVLSLVTDRRYKPFASGKVVVRDTTASYQIFGRS